MTKDSNYKRSFVGEDKIYFSTTEGILCSAVVEKAALITMGIVGKKLNKKGVIRKIPLVFKK